MLEKISNSNIIQNSGLRLGKFKIIEECVPNHSTRKFSTEYMIDKYRKHDEYMPNEELSSNQGTLYSVSQHVPTVNTSYGSLCTSDRGFSTIGNDWKREQVMQSLDHADNSNTDGFSIEKQKTDKVGMNSVSVPVSSNTLSSDNGGSQQGLCHARKTSPTSMPTCVYLMSRTALHLDMENASNATADSICQAIINCEELSLNRQLALQVFTLWLCSPLLGMSPVFKAISRQTQKAIFRQVVGIQKRIILHSIYSFNTTDLYELQLKPTHKPYEVKRCWRSLLEQYSHGTCNRTQRDEPLISLQRNIFFSQQLEEKIKDQKIIELLYEEAKYNILEGRYPCETAHYIMLGGIQARIELGPYNPQVHSTHYFREEQAKYLPVHVRKSATWTWLPISSKNSAEVRLLEQFKRIPTSATNRKLMKKYLEFCWSLPYYGAAFFEGQVEQPVRGLTTLMTHQDIPVLVAINARGIYIIDDIQCTLLVGLRYEELSWDHARPSKEDDPNCLPCLFIQFLVLENGARVSKILQIFSKQTSLMDKVISGFVHQMKKKTVSDETDRITDHPVTNDESHMPITIGPQGHTSTPTTCLSNKLSRLTLATFDEDGHCVGQMGSWSFGY